MSPQTIHSVVILPGLHGQARVIRGFVKRSKITENRMTEKRENSYYKDIEDFTDIGEGIEIISNSFLTHFIGD